jgi:single-strand DNA-binding protein
MAVVSFGLATNRVWVTKQGERKEDAQFHRIVAWNKLAELCSQLLAKGRRIYVEGRIQYRDMVDAENSRRQIAEIVIDDMIILDNKGVGDRQNTAQNFAPAGGASAPAPAEEFVPEDGKLEDIVIPDEIMDAETSAKSTDAPKEEMPF